MKEIEKSERAIQLMLDYKNDKVPALVMVEEVYEGKPGVLVAFTGTFEQGVRMMMASAKHQPAFAKLLDAVALKRSNEKIDQLLKDKKMAEQN